MASKRIHSSSFRDPAGFLFFDKGTLLRQVNRAGKEDYEYLMSSGLYDHLVSKGWLIPHEELPGHTGLSPDAFKVIQPENIDFISYPYEWSFSQLKDAALTTLRIQKAALQQGMWLKDASAYNIQFRRGKPVFIDTLSFEKYPEGHPWPAYRQFVEHFLGPLALMSYVYPDLNRLLSLYLDGIPLERTVRLLPFRPRLKLSLQMHLFMHARAQKKHKQSIQQTQKATLAPKRLFHLIESLGQAIQGLRLHTKKTMWAGYYGIMNYSDAAFDQKKELVSGYLKKIKPKLIWDLGANTGEFAIIAAQEAAECIAFDIDPLATEAFYLFIKKNKVKNVLPLVMDLANPSPAIGWENKERAAFCDRRLPDTVMALALIHHLAIAHNLPLERIASFFSSLGDHLIIEFVPKEDSQTQRMLATRKDLYPWYDEENFEKAFSEKYTILEKRPVAGTVRTMYLMRKSNT